MKLKTYFLLLLFQRFLIALLVFNSIAYLFFTRERKYYFLFLYLFFPTFSAVLLALIWKSTFIDRQFSPSLVPYFIFLAAGIVIILKNNLHIILASIFIACVLGVSLFYTVYSWDDKSYSTAYNFISRNKNKKIAVITTDDQITLPFIYYNQLKITQLILPEYYKKHVDEAFKMPYSFCKYFDSKKELLKELKNYLKIYLIIGIENKENKKIKDFIKTLIENKYKIKNKKKIQHLFVLSLYASNSQVN